MHAQGVGAGAGEEVHLAGFTTLSFAAFGKDEKFLQIFHSNAVELARHLRIGLCALVRHVVVAHVLPGVLDFLRHADRREASAVLVTRALRSLNGYHDVVAVPHRRLGLARVLANNHVVRPACLEAHGLFGPLAVEGDDLVCVHEDAVVRLCNGVVQRRLAVCHDLDTQRTHVLPLVVLRQTAAVALRGEGQAVAVHRRHNLHDVLGHAVGEACAEPQVLPALLPHADAAAVEPLLAVLPRHPVRAVVRAQLVGDGQVVEVLDLLRHLRVLCPLRAAVRPVARPLRRVPPRVADLQQPQRVLSVDGHLARAQDGVRVACTEPDRLVLLRLGAGLACQLPAVPGDVVLARRAQPQHAVHLVVGDDLVEEAVHQQLVLHVPVERHRREACEVRHGDGGVSAADGDVRAVQLRVRLLHDGHPQLVRLVEVLREAGRARLLDGLHGEVRVDDVPPPPAVLGEAAPVDALLHLLQAVLLVLLVVALCILVVEHRLDEVVGRLGTGGDSREEPAVTERSLVDVARLDLLLVEAEVLLRRVLVVGYRELRRIVLGTHPRQGVLLALELATDGVLERRPRQVDVLLRVVGQHGLDGAFLEVVGQLRGRELRVDVDVGVAELALQELAEGRHL
eukprot:Rhum_TRINITY_DN549_c0_g1::Rhum_TRINITY_DN549_c0_g1_i1::g.1750::m.1750